MMQPGKTYTHKQFGIITGLFSCRETIFADKPGRKFSLKKTTPYAFLLFKPTKKLYS
jgi:hypothetical protein